MRKAAISLTALLGFLGVGVQFVFSVSRRMEEGHSFLYGVQYFFSYFSILSSTAVAVLLGSYVLFPESRLSRWFQRSAVNAGVALYILIVGMIFYLLLYKPGEFGLSQIATHIIHGFLPIAYFLIWLLTFRKGDLRYGHSLQWLSAVLVYFVYILLRGYFQGVYPYFFVDVNKYGYGGVSLYALGISLIFLLVGLLIIVIDRRKR